MVEADRPDEAARRCRLLTTDAIWRERDGPNGLNFNLYGGIFDEILIFGRGGAAVCEWSGDTVYFCRLAGK